MISASIDFEGSAWTRPAFTTLNTLLTKFFETEPGMTLSEDDLSILELFENDELDRYTELGLDFLIDAEKFDVTANFSEAEEHGDVDTYSYIITCNDKNAALDLKALKNDCSEDFIYFLDNVDVKDSEARAGAFAAAVALDSTGLLQRYMESEAGTRVSGTETIFKYFVRA
jgi:hypothetical protein